MNDSFNVSKENIILYGNTIPPFEGHMFIVYINVKDKYSKIHVNTYFIEDKNDVYRCCVYYDRTLCETMEEFEKLTMRDIYSQAYGSWMDGAR